MAARFLVIMVVFIKVRFFESKWLQHLGFGPFGKCFRVYKIRK